MMMSLTNRWGTDVIGRDISLSYCEGRRIVLDSSKSIGGDYVMYRKWSKDGLSVDCPSGLHENLTTHGQQQRLGSQGFSWKPELAEVTPLVNTSFPPDDCDFHFHEPTLLVKADFPSHIYHHFTSILNAWLALHVAGLPADGSARVVFVDKFGHRLREDRSHHEFFGTFSEAWYPFTKYPILDIRHLGPTATNGGKKLCLDHAVLVHPPRCSFFYPTRDYVAGTFDADVSRIPLLSTDDIGDGNDTILDKGTTTHDPRTYDQGARDFTQPVRVTYISRHKNTKDRKLTNEKELLELIATLGYGRDGRTSIALRTVDFAGMTFREQIAVVQDTDVLVGMHGAGLTNLMWLPRQLQERVALVEIYNTEDEFCFKDLAALNGVKYFTWDVAKTTLLHPHLAADDTLTARNAKQLNYAPDSSAFATLVREAVEYVIGEPTDTDDGNRDHDDL